jgi:mono/diheme cytochrome c family protein
MIQQSTPRHYMMIVVLAWTAGSLHAQTNAAQVARGKYLVEGVGLCADCHTPHNERGEPDRARWLIGAPIAFQPLQPIPGWANVAPSIAGLPNGWTDADMIRFLQTGIRRNGMPPGPPMPPYRLNQADAEAVTAYLKSLRPTGRTP